MPYAQRRYSKEEIAQRGDAIYQRDIEPRLTKRDQGKYVAIDIETSDHEMASDELAAIDQLRARVPDAQIWLVRVGTRSVHRLGGGTLRGRA